MFEHVDKNFTWDNFVTSAHTRVAVDVECENFDEINEDLKRYLANHMSFMFTNDPSKPTWDRSLFRYDNFVPSVATFIKENPKLQKFIVSLGLRIREVYFSLSWRSLVYEHDLEQRNVILPPHIDSPPVIWKLNWPVMNMENSSLRFFERRNPEQSLDPIMDGVMVPFEYVKPVKELAYDTKKCFFQNASTIHDAVLNGPIEFPRIGMFVMFFNEPNLEIIPDNPDISGV